MLIEAKSSVYGANGHSIRVHGGRFSKGHSLLYRLFMGGKGILCTRSLRVRLGQDLLWSNVSRQGGAPKCQCFLILGVLWCDVQCLCVDCPGRLLQWVDKRVSAYRHGLPSARVGPVFVVQLRVDGLRFEVEECGAGAIGSCA